MYKRQIKSRKGVNIPNKSLDLEYISEADRNDILFGIEMDVDYVAASFVRSGRDVEELRTLLNDNGGKKIKIISKIENVEGISNFHDILRLSDGIMAVSYTHLDVYKRQEGYHEALWNKGMETTPLVEPIPGTAFFLSLIHI